MSGFFLVSWLCLAAMMAGLWWIQARTRNAGIVDVAWAVGTGAVVLAFGFTESDGDPNRCVLVAGLALVWSARLAWHLLSRIMSESEDGRYRYMRESFPNRTQLIMFAFFQVQAGWAILFALPILAAMRNTTALWTLWDILGLIIWIGAFIGETIADRQLAKFRTDPANQGRVCDRGLWRYSRHPNYFFEWLFWWAYLCFAIHSPWWWLALGGVVLMYFFLTKITGIPFTEAQAERSRGEAYREYQRTTSAFFPLPPKAV
ncbi:MAG: DUF1295 domain-containing protein [Pseudomonadota bacterium]